MIYYNKNNEKVIIPDEILNNVISHGECGTVYRLSNDLCFKKYDRTFTTKNFRINQKIVDLLNSIDNDNIVEIIDILFNQKQNYHYIADAYIMKYYLEKYKNILELPTTYLLENVENILDLSMKCSNLNIRFGDLKDANTIYTKDKIILLDPDLYDTPFHISTSELIKINNSIISGFFNELVLNTLNTNYQQFLADNDLFTYSFSFKLFPITVNANRTMKVLEKKLKGYARPIDYVYSKKKTKRR